MKAGETSNAQAFMREPAQRIPQREDKLMTIAERLEQTGIKKGIQPGVEKGRLEGRSEGEREATRKIARTMLQNGIDSSTVATITGLSENELAQMRH